MRGTSYCWRLRWRDFCCVRLLRGASVGEQVDGSEGEEGVEGIAEAGGDEDDEVSGEWDEGEVCEEEGRAGAAVVEGEEEAEDSGDAEGGIEDAAGEGHEAVFGVSVDDAEPEEISAIERGLSEGGGRLADSGFGLRHFFAAVGELTDLPHAVALDGVKGRVGDEVEGSGEAVAVAETELDAEVGARGDEGVEDALIAEHPGREEGEEDEGGEGGAGEAGAEWLRGAKKNVDAGDGEDEQERGIEEGDDSPGEAVEGPEDAGIVVGESGGVGGDVGERFVGGGGGGVGGRFVGGESGGEIERFVGGGSGGEMGRFVGGAGGRFAGGGSERFVGGAVREICRRRERVVSPETAANSQAVKRWSRKRRGCRRVGG